MTPWLATPSRWVFDGVHFAPGPATLEGKPYLAGPGASAGWRARRSRPSRVARPDRPVAGRNTARYTPPLRGRADPWRSRSSAAASAAPPPPPPPPPPRPPSPPPTTPPHP